MKTYIFAFVMALASQGKASWFESFLSAQSIPAGASPIAMAKPMSSEERMKPHYDKLLLDSRAGAMIGGVLPKTYQEIINQGHDAPISLIQNQHTSSRDYWSKQKSKSDSRALSFLKMDTEVFGELNLRAADVWDELIACNGNNGEAARRAFFEFQNLCPNPDQKARTTDRLKELAQNYQQFLISTQIIDIDYRSPLVKNPPVFEAFREGIHPLIAQFAIQQWAVFLNHTEEKKQEVSFEISEMLDVRSANALYRGMRSDDFSHLIQAFPSAQEKLLREVVNNLVVLMFLNGEHLQHPCGIYGLWPAMNRVILRHDYYYMWGGLGTSLDSYLSKLDRTTEKYCGRPVRYIDAGGGKEGIYGTSGILHIASLRAMFRFYVGTAWENDIER